MTATFIIELISGRFIKIVHHERRNKHKLSIASEDDVRNVAECVPGCVVPFGFADHITLLLDKNIFQHTDYLFSPGVTTKTIQLNIQDTKILLSSLPNKIIEV